MYKKEGGYYNAVKTLYVNLMLTYMAFQYDIYILMVVNKS